MSVQDQSPALPRDAFVFVHGLGAVDGGEQSGQAITQRIADALDRNAQTRRAQFVVRAGSQSEEYALGQGVASLKTNTILRKDGDRSVPVIDLYELEYDPSLTRNYQSTSVATISLLLLFGIVANLPNFIRAFLPHRKAKTFREKLQLAFMLFIMFLLFVYLIILLVALIEAIPSQLLTQVPALQTLVDSRNAVLSLLKFSPTLVVVVAALGVFWPNMMGKLRDHISEAAIHYMSAIDYISLGSRKDQIIGQVASTLEHIGEKSDVQYRNIHVIAYSFGTLIALDSLFQPGAPPPRAFGVVHTLVTIGCPYDLIRMIWPDYFKGRVGLPREPERWINIFSPADILGSNFRDDDHVDAPSEKILREGFALDPTVIENMDFVPGSGQMARGFLATLTLAGLRAHAFYWSLSGYEGERTCFDQLMVKMYENDPLLA